MRCTLALLALLTCLAAIGSEGPPAAAELRELATRYEHGRGVEQDYGEAFRLYCLAAERGDAEAHYHLGWMYFNERGVPRDPARAAWWLRHAVDAGVSLPARMLSAVSGTDPQPDPQCGMLADDRPTRAQIEGWLNRWAPAYGLDPALVLAVIATESAFDPGARSPKNAQGLMQLIPATAERFGVEDVWDPVQNMRGGMVYLRWLMDRFEGDVRLALAAYNAGEGAVEKYGGIPPYRETREYVRRVLSRLDADSDHGPRPLLVSLSGR